MAKNERPEVLRGSRGLSLLWETVGANGRHVVMDDDEPTPITQEFPPEPEPELTDADIIDAQDGKTERFSLCCVDGLLRSSEVCGRYFAARFDNCAIAALDRLSALSFTLRC